MAIESRGEQSVIVSVDINGVSYNLIEAVRAKIAKSGTELDPMKVVYAATHTHTAPTYPRFNSTVKSEKSFFAFADLCFLYNKS